MASVTELIERLWQGYSSLNPQARAIHELLRARGESVVNDHIALRTYDDPRVGLDALAASFVRCGYQPRGEYAFPEKKLFARHFEHLDESLPRVFISELKLKEFPAAFSETVRSLIDQLPGDLAQRWDFPISGRPWKVGFAQYELLRARSEYAAWMAAWGFRANHFTILVNSLKTFSSLAELNGFLKQNGFRLNDSGGEIKGSPQVFLEQSSTLADQAEVDFSDGLHRIPACYYEFARRYPLADGRLYGGFVEKSADKIFESTHKR